MIHATSGRGVNRLAYRVARFVCPAAKRHWIDAMFAEFDAAEFASGSGWMLGALPVVWSAVRLRMASLPAMLSAALAGSSLAVLLFSMGSQSDVEALSVDDDVFLQLAWLSGVLVVGLGVLAITWIFTLTDIRPRHRH